MPWKLNLPTKNGLRNLHYIAPERQPGLQIKLPISSLKN